MIIISKKRSRKKTIKKKDNAMKENNTSFKNSSQQIELDYNDCLNQQKMI